MFTGKLRYSNTLGQQKTCNLFYSIAAKLKYMYISYQINIYNREAKHHVYVKRQTRICTTSPIFLFTCRLLFIIYTPKVVVSRNFLSMRIVLSCFYLLIFYFEEFASWIWRSPFAVYVKVKLSDVSEEANRAPFKISSMSGHPLYPSFPKPKKALCTFEFQAANS